MSEDKPIDTQSIANDIKSMLIPIEAEGERLGYKGNKLTCYVKNQFRNKLKELKETLDRGEIK